MVTESSRITLPGCSGVGFVSIVVAPAVDVTSVAANTNVVAKTAAARALLVLVRLPWMHGRAGANEQTLRMSVIR